MRVIGISMILPPRRGSTLISYLCLLTRDHPHLHPRQGRMELGSRWCPLDLFPRPATRAGSPTANRYQGGWSHLVRHRCRPPPLRSPDPRLLGRRFLFLAILPAGANPLRADTVSRVVKLSRATARRAALEAVAASWIIEGRGRGPCAAPVGVTCEPPCSACLKEVARLALGGPCQGRARRGSRAAAPQGAVLISNYGQIRNATGLFVPKANRRADCHGCGPSDLGTTVRQRPPASGDERADCYSVGYSARERVGPGPGPRLARSQVIPCLQSSAKVSRTVSGLGRSTPRGPYEEEWSRVVDGVS
jgi:hypothetical protein